MRRALSTLGLACALAVSPAASRAHDMAGMAAMDMPGMGKLGRVSFPVACARGSRPKIEHGVALLHSFGYAEAEAVFQDAAARDPGCAMAYWGVAMTQYQEIWTEPEAAALKRGQEQLAKARAAATRATPREQAYIAALGAFFDLPVASFQARAAAYAAAMDALHAHFPGDVEAGAFDALAILASTPPDDTSLAHARKALAILEPLFEAHPDHPGLAHYIIHACDTPSLARKGLKAARVYARIAPASAHARHMPAHIFSRLGLWREDIASNLSSVAASRAAEAAGRPGAAHQLHADEFLAYAYLQTGQAAKARTLAARMAAVGGRMLAMPGMDDMKDEGHFVDNELRTIVSLETRDWKALAVARPAPGSRPYETFVVAWGQGIAAGRLHDARLAARALADFDRSFASVKASPYAAYAPSLRIRRDELLGWQALAEDRPRDAETAMRRAADRQDKLGQGEVDIPAREMLADLLGLEHRPREAAAEYRAALKLSPNRRNGLKGLREAEHGLPRPAAEA